MDSQLDLGFEAVTSLAPLWRGRRARSIRHVCHPTLEDQTMVDEVR